ncbi:MAG: type II toxin-antitoxin system RelE/ParE family toxin [Armatimonadetes bacterium]|nr:type II toxin-antitoxin system RelE/ParE family toxin [Armatimonadota bacterium]
MTLSGPFRGLRRLRVGDYRVVYLVREHDQTVKVVLLSHRRDVYDKLGRMDLDALE